MTDLETANHFCVLRPLPISKDIQFLQFSFELEFQPRPTMDVALWWTQLCKHLSESLPSLVDVNIWLSTKRLSTSFVQYQPDLFVFDPKLASVVTVNLPTRVNVLQAIGMIYVEPRFRIQLRNYCLWEVEGKEARLAPLEPVPHTTRGPYPRLEGDFRTYNSPTIEVADWELEYR